MTAEHPEIGEEIRTRRVLTEDLTARVKAAIQEFKTIAAAPAPAR